jgi:hypothetical protein
MTKEYRVVVEKVVKKGPHGSYAVAKLEGSGSVTFSLSGDTWGESSEPEKGVFVVIGELVRKRSGWRALKARYLRPEDEQTAALIERSKER